MRFADLTRRLERRAATSTSALGLGFILVLAASACTETTSPPVPGPKLGPEQIGDVPGLALLKCSGSAAGIKCAPTGRTGLGPLYDRTLGGQDRYVRLDAQDFTFDGSTLNQDVDLQNLTVQPFGTTDWETMETDPVRVFFHSLPTNGVTVINADGAGDFTGTNQIFFLYNELIPANQRNLNTKTWSFNFPTPTTTFDFEVFVEVKMPDEEANIEPPPYTFAELSRGSLGDHSCAIRSDGTEYCWGNNFSGALGERTLNNRLTAAGVLGDLRLTGLVRGGDGAGGSGVNSHTCGLDANGAAYCWGSNVLGALGDGTTTSRSIARPVSGGQAFVQLAAGAYHTCGLTDLGAAYCWGYNAFGQLGTGTTTQQLTPAAVAAPAGVVFNAIIAGYYHTCGVTATQAAYCWGYNAFGQLGNGTTTTRLTPGAVSSPPGVPFTTIAAGQYHTCALTDTGSAYCWGRNAEGQLGDGTQSQRTTPTAVSTGTYNSLALGASHSCGLSLAPAGAAFCWGRNNEGQLGDGTGTQQNTPVPVIGPDGGESPALTFSALAGGYYHTCGLSSGVAYCWGYNANGELGNGQTFFGVAYPVRLRFGDNDDNDPPTDVTPLPSRSKRATLTVQ